jgi:hypothetical protein
MIESLLTMVEAIWAIGVTVRDNIKSERLWEQLKVKRAVVDIQHEGTAMNIWK